MPNLNESKELAPENIYQERLSKYKVESQGLSALEKHVFPFLDNNRTFSPATITAELNKMHASGAGIKGLLIAAFNANHGKSGVCPVLKAQFAADKNQFARFLHLGTTRVWNADGSVNEENWTKFIAYIAQVQNNNTSYLAKSTLLSYLQKCYNEDKPDNTTGRNANAFFSLGKAQAGAGSAAWNEVFDRLTGKWIVGSNGKAEPCLTIEDTRSFFEDSAVVFLKAECGLLPIAKPRIEDIPAVEGSVALR
jgi:hypothetical protein